MKKIIALVLLTILAVTCFAGCKGQETIVVGYTIYAPMNYMENGELIGFDTELAKAVFEGMNCKVVFKEIDWKAKYTELDSGNIDCIWNGFTANAADDDGVQRSEKVDFSYNYMENLQVVVAKKGADIATKEDLNGKIADAELGSAGESYAKGFEGTTFKGAVKQTDCLLSVKTDNADFAVVDAQLAKSYCGKGDYADLEIIEALSSDVEYYAIGFKKGSELTSKVNEQLEKLASDGTIAKLGEKYNVATSVITDYSSQK
ncbi:MAG: transporter substrate-binding domain-containing protein [Clostridia bacterium]|nr:transporter substrate-binding domain-containing protein [Clostridia bacterium]